MFSRSFASSIKSPQDTAEDLARRAYPTNRTVRRSPACSGEEHYTYKHDGFRVFENGQGNHAENLVEDYKHFIAGGNDTTLPYHHAIAALHHAHTAHSVEILIRRRHIIEQLTTTPNTNPNPNPTPKSASHQPASHQPASQQPDYTLSRHLLDKMKYALPQHPKTLVIVRPDCCHANFDPANVPPERTFIKKCCEEPSSADTCCCHVGTSNESVQYTNALGECLTVHYFYRKNDYFNATFRMFYNPSDDEKRVPHSPSDEVSESEIFPACCDSAFQNEIDAATTAAAEGFTHVWKNKSYKRRFERRQHRRQQLASDELPKYGLILVILDTEETRACRPHPIAGHDDERRQLYKARYEKIRDAIHTQAIAQGLITEPQPEQQPQQQPDNLLYYLMRRKLQHISRASVVCNIQRHLNGPTLSIAHGVARTQVTAISALHPHQRLRTVAGSLIALLAIRLSCERTDIKANVNQHLYDYRNQHYVHNLHHDGIHRILRRASGSQNRAKQIASPYISYATKLSQNIPAQIHAAIKQRMADRFKTPMPPYPQFLYGSHSFHKAVYYARECLKLIDDRDTASASASASASRWANLSAKVQSVRRGERTPYDVLTDSNDDYWVYAIHYTFILAGRNYLDANKEWLQMLDRPSIHDEGTAIIRVDNGASLFWQNSNNEIRINASRVVQTTLMIRSMYRFIVQASCVLSPEFVSVFGFDQNFINVMISRAKHLATHDGDEASALIFGHFFPCLMTPDVHLDIFVGGNIFQHPELYVKTSDNVLGKLKKEFREVIPSRHTGTIDRATLMQPPTIRCRA